MNKYFSAAVMAITLLFSPMAMANVNPQMMISNAIIVTDTTCPEGLLSLPEVEDAIGKAGYTIKDKTDVTGADATLLTKAISLMTPPPTGTEEYRLYDLGDRILISALNNRCSLGALVLPTDVLMQLLMVAAGQPA